jgi:hypothetical protein
MTIPEEDIVLILMYLNSEARIAKFMEWIHPRLAEEPPRVTVPELCRAAVWIHEGRTDLP